jgi:hypothetical protein
MRKHAVLTERTALVFMIWTELPGRTPARARETRALLVHGEAVLHPRREVPGSSFRQQRARMIQANQAGGLEW